MADASNGGEADENFLKCLIRTRLNMEEEFALRRMKKSLLWDKVIEKVKEKVPNTTFNRDQMIRKYLNLVTTYKRIIRNKESGAKTTNWEFFSDFDEIYGTMRSAGFPTYKLSPVENSMEIDLNEIKCEPCEYSTESFNNYTIQPIKKEPCEYSTEFFKSYTVPPIKEETFDDSTESESIGPSNKEIKNEILEYLEKESVRKQKRHEEILDIERKRLKLGEEKLKAMIELNDILVKAIANKSR